MYVYVPVCEYMYLFIVGFISVAWIGSVCANSDKAGWRELGHIYYRYSLINGCQRSFRVRR